MPKTPAEMIAAITRNLPKRTGRSLDEWVRIVQTEGPPLLKDRIDWLRRQYLLGSVTSKLISDAASGGSWLREYDDAAGLVDALYAGAREPIRKAYDRIVELAAGLGDDVKASPRKTYTSLIRNRQFAVIKPGGQKRVEVGLALGSFPARGRLEATAPSGTSDRITHHVKVSSLAEIDSELEKWMRKAYDMDGGDAADESKSRS